MLTSYLQKMRLFNRDVWLYLASATVIGFGFFGIAGVLFNLYLLRLGYGPEFVGTLFAIGSLSWAAVSLPAGTLGRRWGLRRTMICGMIMMAVGASLMPCADLIPLTWRAVWLISTLLSVWIGGAFWIVNGIPFLAGASGDEERPHAISTWLAIIPFSGFFGALIAGRLPALFAAPLGVPISDPAPFRYSLWVGTLLYIPGLLALFSTRRVAAGSSSLRSDAGPAPIAIFLVLGVVSFFGKAAMAAPQTFFNVYLDAGLHQATPLIGTLMAVAQLLSAATALAAPLVMARFGKHATFALACLGMACGLLLLGLVPQWIAAGLGYATLSAMAFVADAGFNVSSQEAVAPGWRPTVAGVALMAEGLSRASVGLAGGYAVVAYGYRTVFAFVAVLAAAASVLFWVYFRGRHDEPVQT
jgi:MFS family permease